MKKIKKSKKIVIKPVIFCAWCSKKWNKKDSVCKCGRSDFIIITEERS